MFRPLHPQLATLLLHFEIVLRPIYSFLHLHITPPDETGTRPPKYALGARIHYFWAHDKIWDAEKYSNAVARAMYLMSGNTEFGGRRTRALQSFLCETFVSLRLCLSQLLRSVLTSVFWSQIAKGGEASLSQRAEDDIAHLSFDHSNATADAAYIGDGTSGVTGLSSKMIYLHIAVAHRWFLFWGFTDVSSPHLHIHAFRETGSAPNDDRLVRAAHNDLPSPLPQSPKLLAQPNPTSRVATIQDIKDLLDERYGRVPIDARLSTRAVRDLDPEPEDLGSIADRAQNLLSAHLQQPGARPVSLEQARLIVLVTNPNLNEDLLVGLRPGGGKTLGFEIAARLHAVRTIIFMAPLKSLAVDLIARALKARVQASYWHTECKPNGGILFIALEQAGSADLHSWLKRNQVNIHCIVLDEIHGAAIDAYRSESWQHIDELRHLTDDPSHRVIPFIGLSGSLSPAIQSFVTQHFRLRHPRVLQDSLNVPHLSYSFHGLNLDPSGSLTHERHFVDFKLADLINQEQVRLKNLFGKRRPTRQTLVLFASMLEVDEASSKMAQHNPGVGRYHSRVPAEEQVTTLAAVREGTCTILFATSGAATGLDAGFTQVIFDYLGFGPKSQLILCCLSQVIFFGSPWDIVSFQQGSSRCGRRSCNGQVVPGAVHIVQANGGLPPSTHPATDSQIRAGKLEMVAFVESLRVHAETPSPNTSPPCFRQVQYAFLRQDSRRCLGYTDGSLPCSSCVQVQTSQNATLSEFSTFVPDQQLPPLHPSVVSAQNDQRRIAQELDIRVSPM